MQHNQVNDTSTASGNLRYDSRHLDAAKLRDELGLFLIAVASLDRSLDPALDSDDEKRYLGVLTRRSSASTLDRCYTSVVSNRSIYDEIRQPYLGPRSLLIFSVRGPLVACALDVQQELPL